MALPAQSHIQEDTTRDQVQLLIRRFASEHSEVYGKWLPQNTERMPLLLREIDETVLPRVLIIDLGHNRQARMVVSNRRLSAVAVRQGSEQVCCAEGATPQDFARSCIDVLATQFEQCPQIRFLAPLRLQAEPVSQISCSARLLANAADLPAEAQVDPTGEKNADNPWIKLSQLALAWCDSAGASGQNKQANGTDLRDVVRQVHDCVGEKLATMPDRLKFKGSMPYVMLLPLTQEMCAVALQDKSRYMVALVSRDKTEAAAHLCKSG